MATIYLSFLHIRKSIGRVDAFIRQSVALRGLLVSLVVLLSLSSASLLNAQDGQEEANKQDNAEVLKSKPEAPKKVDVKPVARDSEITSRLNDILESTKWFNEPSVEVDNGVVFLAGEAAKSEYKEWATELANNTQDVAAVVNRMTIKVQSIWDFSSAFAELRDFQAGTVQAIPFLLFGLAILVVTWLLAGLASRLSDRFLTNRIRNNLLRWVTTRALILPILIFGVYLVLRVSGLTQLALTILGGTGLLGLIIGIAFQDIAENFLASILISVQTPFRVGDLIRVGEHQGIVDRVTTRGTTILTKDGNHVQIPNSQIYKTTIENFTANPLRRISFDIGIGYDDSVSDAQDLILGTVKKHSASLNDPPPKVIVENLGAATVNLTVLFWIDGTRNDFFAVRSSIMRITKQRLVQSSISLPDESREVIFPSGVPLVIRDDRLLQEISAASSGESNNNTGEKPDLHDVDDRILNSARSLPPLPPQKPQSEEVDFSEAEGNMKVDTEELQRQAEQSWNPDQGQEILMSDDSVQSEA